MGLKMTEQSPAKKVITEKVNNIIGAWSIKIKLVLSLTLRPSSVTFISLFLILIASCRFFALLKGDSIALVESSSAFGNTRSCCDPQTIETKANKILQ